MMCPYNATCVVSVPHTRLACEGRTRSVVSQPGNAIEILNTDRDVWKKRALDAEKEANRWNAIARNRREDVELNLQRALNAERDANRWVEACNGALERIHELQTRALAAEAKVADLAAHIRRLEVELGHAPEGSGAV